MIVCIIHSIVYSPYCNDILEPFLPDLVEFRPDLARFYTSRYQNVSEEMVLFEDNLSITLIYKYRYSYCLL